jgi:TetR/AcrR family transcriptional regulator, repressor for neighboring sulfatase
MPHDTSGFSVGLIDRADDRVDERSRHDRGYISLVAEPPRPRRGRPPKNAEAPRGPSEVTSAVIEVATELFSRQGIGTVSIRQVAAKAGVNPGLIHRYIGSKDELLRAVLENFATQLEDSDTRLLDGPLSEGTERLMLTHQRIIAHLILEGYDLNDFYTRTPLVAIILDAIQRETAVDDHTARIRAVQILALGLGWRLFESFLTSATGLGAADRDEIQAAIRKTNFAIGRGDLP